MRPFVTDPAASIVRLFRSVVEARAGNADVEMMPGWGDIEFLATDHQVPALYFGPGDLAAAHTADEYLDLDRYHEAILIYDDVIQAFLTTGLRAERECTGEIHRPALTLHSMRNTDLVEWRKDSSRAIV